MPLKKTSQLEIDQLAMVVYGQPEAGKTSLAMTAKNPVVIDFDKLAYKANIEGFVWEVNKWQDALDLISSPDLHKFDTVIIDTLSSAQMMLEQHLKEESPKLVSRVGPTRDGWRRMVDDFRQFVNAFKLAGKNVVIVAHEALRQEGDDYKFEPKCTGSFIHDIKMFIPVIGRMYAQDNKRVLDFTFKDNQMTKGGVLGSFTNPENLEDIITQYQAKLNENRTKSNRVFDEIKDAQKVIDSIKDLDTLNAAVEAMKDLRKPIKLQVADQFKTKVTELEKELGELEKIDNNYVIKEQAENINNNTR